MSKEPLIICFKCKSPRIVRSSVREHVIYLATEEKDVDGNYYWNDIGFTTRTGFTKYECLKCGRKWEDG